MKPFALSHLADQSLLHRLAALIEQGRVNTADVVACIAEVDARALYAAAGYPSMHLYCLGELRLSEDAAFKRIRVARAARKFPAILPAIAAGRLNLSSALLLIPHLAPESAEELLSAAAGKTNAQVELLLAKRFPSSDLPTVLEAIPPSPGTASLAVRPVDSTPAELTPEPGEAPNSSLAARPVGATPAPLDPAAVEARNPSLAARPVSGPARSKLAPLSPQRFGLQTTIDQATHDKLRYAQELLGAAIPSGDVAQVLDRALDALIRQLEKRRFAAGARQGAARESKSNRYVPAKVREAVWRRDGGRCTFVSDTGHRCESRKFLEFDHIEPVANGGPSTVANLRLRCRAHNQLAAERALGTEFMRRKREAARERRAEASQSTEQARADAAEKAREAAEQVRAAVHAQLHRPGATVSSPAG